MSQDSVTANHNSFEEKGEPKQNRCMNKFGLSQADSNRGSSALVLASVTPYL